MPALFLGGAAQRGECRRRGARDVAEVTVIAPNVVEFVGNLARQTPTTAAQTAPPPPPPPKPDQPLKTRDDAGGQSRQLAANQNVLARSAPRPTIPRSTSPGGFNLSGNAQRRPAQPSSQFLAQQIAQETAGSPRARRSFSAAAAAYGSSRLGRTVPIGEPVIVTQSVNRLV